MRKLILVVPFISSLLTITIAASYNDKIKNDWWLTHDNSSRACRDSEGYHRCSGRLLGVDICVTRMYASIYCNDQLRCGDDELRDVSLCVPKADVPNSQEDYENIYLACHSDEFECEISRKCIPRLWVKDGETDCSLVSGNTTVMDQSDEQNFLPSCDDETEFSCHGNRSRCIPRSMVRDGKEDCPGGRDEVVRLKCHVHTEFLCPSNSRCILRRYVNDGFLDCPSGEDESVSDFVCYGDFEYSCADDRCIPRQWINNNVKDCTDGADESVRFVKCVQGEFACLDGRRCLPSKYKCDGIQNCQDGSDERELCFYPTMARCSPESPELFPWVFILHDQAKYPYIKSYCTNTASLQLIPYSLMQGLKCYIHQESTKELTTKRRGVPEIYTAKNISICAKNEDNCFDRSGTFLCEKCLDGTVISKSQVCDDIIDCPDLSDECTCERSQVDEVCQRIYFNPNSEGNETNPNIICNGKVEMENGIDEKFCDHEVLNYDASITELNESGSFECFNLHSSANTPTLHNSQGEALFCDGRVDCPLKEDECVARCLLPQLHNVTLEKAFRLLKTCFPQIQLHVPNVKCFPSNEDECLYFEVESRAEDQRNYYISIAFDYSYSTGLEFVVIHDSSNEPDFPMGYRNLDFVCDIKGVVCPWMFVCKSNELHKLTISKVCDHKIDCEDRSDEENCSRQTHFYCKNGIPPFIPRSKVRDGRSDCADRSDECRDTLFSSVREMIKDKFLSYFIWFSGIITLLANGIVLTKHFQKLRKVPSKSSVPYCNTLLLINLALSDALFGVTLIGVAIKAHQFSGRYCEFDLHWRSSFTCSLIGVLTVVSSQTSMNLLVVMTALRFHVTFHPFTSNQLKFKFVVIFCAASWASACLMAFYPIWNSYRFADLLFIEPNLFMNDQIVNKSHVESFIAKTKQIILFNNNETGGSNMDFSNITAHFPNRYIHVKSLFGFYSSSSVCFPDLYSQTGPMSKYSMFIVLYNLASLLFICVAYSAIFQRAAKSTQATRREGMESAVDKMMMRIIYIILTDVLCWVPIIVMSTMSYNGYVLPPVIHSVSAIVLLPVNSFINPIIYSRLDKIVKEKIRLCFQFLCHKLGVEVEPVSEVIETQVSTR